MSSSRKLFLPQDAAKHILPLPKRIHSLQYVAGVCCQELAIRLVKKIENMCVSHTFPVSYRYDLREGDGTAEGDVD